MKKNLTFVGVCDKILLNSTRKNVIKLAKGQLNNISLNLLNKILSQSPLMSDPIYLN